MTAQRPPAWAGWYLVAQAAATALWWVWMVRDPSARPTFFAEESFEVLRRFAAPDLLVLGCGSLIAGVLVLRDRPGARIAAWFTLGAASYATVGAIAANWPLGAKPAADLAMLASCAGTAFAAVAVGSVVSLHPIGLFRPARSASVPRNAICTLLQTAIMWGIFLAILPAGVLVLQQELGIPRFDAGPWAWVAIALFWIAGLTAIYSSSLFVRFGVGTPFPLDETTRLVIAGPYRWVRNPMAMLGIFQGVMVGVWLGSWPVIVYALSGTFAWHVLARPFEEHDLERRFGAEFTAYRARVRNWIPCARPYHKVMGVSEVTPNPVEAPVSDVP